MLHCKTFCRRGALLVLSAALALTGCTAGLGSEPTVETDPAATPEAAPVLVPENQEDVAYTWMGELPGLLPGSEGDLQEPVSPQMDKQTAANNAAFLLNSAGYSPETLLDDTADIRLAVGLYDRDALGRFIDLPCGSLETLWPDADALYYACYVSSDGPDGAACLFDAITGKVYWLNYAPARFWLYHPLYAFLSDAAGIPEDLDLQGSTLSEETLALMEPVYQPAARAANTVDPAAFVEQLMPQLGWQVKTVNTTAAPWPDTFAQYWQQSMGRRQQWQWIARLDITTGNGSRWAAWYDTMSDRLLELVCLGADGTPPQGLVRDWNSHLYQLCEGSPVPSRQNSYLLQGADGLWYEVTFLNGDDYDAFLQDTDFHAADYLDTMSWLAPGEAGYSYRLLGEGFPLEKDDVVETAG